MKRFSIAGGVVCSRCGMMAQVVWARSSDEAWAGAGVCKACHQAGGEKHAAEPAVLVSFDVGLADEGLEEGEREDHGGEGDGSGAAPAAKRGRRAKSRGMPAEASSDEDG